MTHFANPPSDLSSDLSSEAAQQRRRKLRDRNRTDGVNGAASTTASTIPMDTFKWIVSGLLGALVIGVGWFLAGIQTDLRDVRREITGMRVESAVTNTKLEELIAEFRRRNPR